MRLAGPRNGKPQNSRRAGKTKLVMATQGAASAYDLAQETLAKNETAFQTN